MSKSRPALDLRQAYADAVNDKLPQAEFVHDRSMSASISVKR